MLGVWNAELAPWPALEIKPALAQRELVPLTITAPRGRGAEARG